MRVAVIGLGVELAARIGHDLQAAHEAVEIVTVSDGATDLAGTGDCELVVVDPKTGSQPTLERLTQVRAAFPRAALIVLTQHADTDDLYQVVRLGGIERYWILPWSHVHAAELKQMVAERRLAHERAARERELADECRALEAENRVLRSNPTSSRPWTWFPQSSETMKACLKVARELAQGTDDACIIGEPGSGRATLALAIHSNGPRNAEPFVRLPAALLRRGTLVPSTEANGDASELHGALRVASKWEAARGGTLFVANVEDLDDVAQAVLAGLVTGDLASGIRIPRLLVSASAHPTELGEEGSLHPRLAARLAGHVLAVPPLRDRAADLAGLAAQLLAEWSERVGRPEPALDEASLNALVRRPFEGNLRELRELLENAALLSGGSRLRLDGPPTR